MLHFRLALVGASLLFLVGACRTDLPPEAKLSRVRAQLLKEPRRLFPLLAGNAYETQVNDLIYQRLTHFDPITQATVPQLASVLPRVRSITNGDFSGSTGYTFSLREGAVWSDGLPVTVADVAFTLKVAAVAQLGGAPVPFDLSEIQTLLIDVSDDPLEFTIVTPAANLNGAATVGNLAIVPAHIFDPQGTLESLSVTDAYTAESLDALPEEIQRFVSDEALAPFGKTRVIGSGPYALEEWMEGQRIRLVRDLDFWGHELEGGLFLAGPDTIDFLVVPDQSAALAMLRNGDIDVVSNIPPREAIALRDETPDVRVFTPLQQTRAFIYLNTKDPLLSDANTRRGLAHLLDVEGFLSDVQLGFGVPLDGPYHPSQSYAADGESPVAFSLQQAREAFAEAGWSDSNGDGILDRVVDGNRQTLQLEYLYPSVSASSEALALLYAADAEEAGVRVIPVGKEFGALLGDLSQRNFQLVQGALGGAPLPDDPYSMWHTDSDSPRGKNRSGFGDASTDALIDSIRVNLDDDSRADQYTRLASRIANERPVLFLVVPQERIGVRAGLEPLVTERRPGYYLPGFKALTDSRVAAGKDATKPSAN